MSYKCTTYFSRRMSLKSRVRTVLDIFPIAIVLIWIVMTCLSTSIVALGRPWGLPIDICEGLYLCSFCEEGRYPLSFVDKSKELYDGSYVISSIVVQFDTLVFVRDYRKLYMCEKLLTLRNTVFLKIYKKNFVTLIVVKLTEPSFSRK